MTPVPARLDTDHVDAALKTRTLDALVRHITILYEAASHHKQSIGRLIGVSLGRTYDRSPAPCVVVHVEFRHVLRAELLLHVALPCDAVLCDGHRHHHCLYRAVRLHVQLQSAGRTQGPGLGFTEIRSPASEAELARRMRIRMHITRHAEYCAMQSFERQIPNKIKADGHS